MIARVLLLALTLLLTGCDLEALLADPRVAQREAEAKAIGGACRYGMRGIEDCYAMNEKASKAAVFNGWKEMDQYMRDNKIDGVPSKLGDGKNVQAESSVAPGEEVVADAKTGKGGKEAAKPAKKASEAKAKPKAAAETASAKKAEEAH